MKHLLSSLITPHDFMLKKVEAEGNPNDFPCDIYFSFYSKPLLLTFSDPIYFLFTYNTLSPP